MSCRAFDRGRSRDCVILEPPRLLRPPARAEVDADEDEDALAEAVLAASKSKVSGVFINMCNVRGAWSESDVRRTMECSFTWAVNLVCTKQGNDKAQGREDRGGRGC